MKAFAVGLIGVGAIAAAIVGSLSAITSNAPNARHSPTSTTQSPSAQSAGFTSANAPQETCGDPSDSATTWYAVFIDGGNLDQVRSKYCKDAIATNRQDSGKASIQVASFTNRSRAETFARKVGGEESQWAGRGAA